MGDEVENLKDLVSEPLSNKSGESDYSKSKQDEEKSDSEL